MRSFVALAAAGASILLLAAVDGEAPLATADSSDQAAPVATKIHPPLVKASAINCATCHAKLTRGKEHVHPPTEDCTSCHDVENEETGTRITLSAEGPALCLGCHEALEKAAAGELRAPHAPVTESCTTCHNPHAAAQERLVRAPGAAPCADCHSDQVAGEGEVAHGTIDLIGCRSCHEPHGSDNPKLLRGNGNGLCLGCHDRKKLKPEKEGDATVKLAGRFKIPAATAASVKVVLLSADGTRGHPVLGHPVTGRAESDPRKRRVTVTFSGELSCLACHDPHKAKTTRLLLGGVSTVTQACLGCHPK